MFLAPVQDIGDVLLLLPVVSKYLLELRGVAKFTYLLELVDTDNEFFLLLQAIF